MRKLGFLVYERRACPQYPSLHCSALLAGYIMARNCLGGLAKKTRAAVLVCIPASIQKCVAQKTAYVPK